MKFLEKIQVIERIDQLIKLKATGSARELAMKTNLSKSTIYEILEIMKMMGAEIEYCNYRKSYYYSRNKVLSIGFVDSKNVAKKDFVGFEKEVANVRRIRTD